MDVACRPISSRRMKNETFVEIEKEETGAQTAEDSKSELFLPESHSLLAVAECISEAAFVTVDPAV